MRKYPRTDETYEVLKSFIGPIAKQYPANDSYIYAIKNGDANDPYPHFRHLFLAAARAGAPVEIWLRDLNGIVEHAGGRLGTVTDLVARLSEKITADADETSDILDAIADRKLDKRECHKILAAVETDIDLNSGIKRLVGSRLAELNERVN